MMGIQFRICVMKFLFILLFVFFFESCDSTTVLHQRKKYNLEEYDQWINQNIKQNIKLTQEELLDKVPNEVLKSLDNDWFGGSPSYGNWCGGGHGGYQDCCNSTNCPACDPDNPVLTDECLSECKPTDMLDFFCARHDTCCFFYPTPENLTCSPQGNYCYCDCAIVKSIANITCETYYCSIYKFSMHQLFVHDVACWHEEPPSLQPVCLFYTVWDSSINYCSHGWLPPHHHPWLSSKFINEVKVDTDTKRINQSQSNYKNNHEFDFKKKGK